MPIPPCMPPCHTCPPPCTPPPAMHTHLPPAMHASLLCIPPPPPCMPPCHVAHTRPPPRQTPVKTLPLQTSFAGGNNCISNDGLHGTIVNYTQHLTAVSAKQTWIARIANTMSSPCMESSRLKTHTYVLKVMLPIHYGAKIPIIHHPVHVLFFHVLLAGSQDIQIAFDWCPVIHLFKP